MARQLRALSHLAEDPGSVPVPRGRSQLPGTPASTSGLRGCLDVYGLHTLLTHIHRNEK